MFETCTSSWSQQLLEGSSLFIRTRLPCESYMQMEINVGNDKGHLPYIPHEAEQVPGQEGSGELNKEPLPPPSTPFIVLHSLPNHRSRYPKGASLTLNICPILPLWWWRAGYSVTGMLWLRARCTNCFQTSQSAVCNFLRSACSIYLSAIYLNQSQVCLSYTKTRTALEKHLLCGAGFSLLVEN